MPGPQKQFRKTLTAAAGVARKLVEDPDYVSSLKARLVSGDVAPAVETMLWNYAYGKPVEVVEVNTSDDLRRSFMDLDDAEFAARGDAILKKIEERLAVARKATDLFEDVPEPPPGVTH